jgi:hypothetical protein
MILKFQEALARIYIGVNSISLNVQSELFVVLIDRKCSVTTNFIRRLKQTQQGQELLD